MESVANLLILFGGILLINMILSLMLWVKNRTRLHRAVFFLWASSVVNFLAQGLAEQLVAAQIIQASDLWVVLSIAFIFPVTLSLSLLLVSLINEQVNFKLFLMVLGLGLVASIGFAFSGLNFTVTALPITFAACFPAIHTVLTRFVKQFKELTFTGKGLVVSTVIYFLHVLDLPFFRQVEGFAQIGFTIAILIIFALSIFAPAVALELITKREARNTAELDVARRIQTNILPKSPQIPGFELVCYMKPAEEVGGDYYDVFTLGDRTWVLLGDVTGHGLSSGLVMLMAQSIIRSVVQTKPEITPKELNIIANQVLFENLQRLNEHRTMTIVSFSCKPSENEFAFSGAHDNIYIWRAATSEVDTIEVGHFPCGLGLLEDVDSFMSPMAQVNLDKDDILFLGTDGITEAARGGDYDQGMFSESGLIEFLAQNGKEPLEQIKTTLVQEIEEYTTGIYHDDVTFMILRKSTA